MHLPPGVLVVKARISLLRLTVPADLYKSGISVEADGVEFCLKVDLTENDRHEAGESKDRKSTSDKIPKRLKAHRSRHTTTHLHDPGGPLAEKSGYDDNSPELLPTTVDLAESFLQAEPKEETAELQTAIAHSQYLEQSQTSSENGGEAPGLGVGNSLSLPGFLAGFLKGVGDRIQVNVKNAEIKLDIKLELPSESSAKSDASDRSEVVTIRVVIGDIAIDGIANSSTADNHTDGSKIPETCQHEKRRISLNKAEAMLISEPYIFTNLARSAVPLSPKTTHAETVTAARRRPTATSSPTDKQGVTAYGRPQHVVSNIQTDQPSASAATADYKEPCSNLEFGEDSSRAMALGESSSIGESQYQESAFPGSFYSNEIEDQIEYQEMENSDMLADDSTYEDSTSDATSPRKPPRQYGHPNPESPQSHKSPPISLNPSPTTSPTKGRSGLGTENLSESTSHGKGSDLRSEHSTDSPPSKCSSPESESSSPLSEDLTQSNIFSHEQAVSMYMSAISHASMHQTKSSTRMPGDWQSWVSDEEDQKPEASHEYLLQTENAASAPQQPPASADGPVLGDHREEQLIERDATPKPLSATPVPSSMSKMIKTPPSANLESQYTIDNRAMSSSGSESSLAASKNFLTMVKRIVFVDSIVLELPRAVSKLTSDSHRVQRPSSPADSSKAAGDLEKGSNVRDFSSATNLPELKRDHPSDMPSSNVVCEASSITVGDVQILADFGLIKMMILIVERSKTELRRAIFLGKEQRAVQKKSYAPDSALLLQVRHISWKCLDLVKGEAFADAQFPHTSTGFDLLTGGSEVLLKADIRRFHIDHKKVDRRSFSKVLVGKVSFGYSTNDILSFDPGLKMRDSTRDVPAPVDNDIFLKIEKSSTALEIDLVTLPLHLSLDLRKLDEAFGWFGGFSSMLGLGSSMMSTVTVTDASSKPIHAAKPARGVHFENPGPFKAPRPETRQTQNKISARIGAFRFDLQGTKSALCFESTAMKLVRRSEGLGLQVDRLNLSGPYLQPLGAEPSLAVKLSNLRIEYLSTPKEIDLARLLALLSPSKDRYERDDDILLETLLRQRRQGGVIRVTVESAESRLSKTADLQYFPALADELKKLSTVAKYLPEDDRPGILTLGLVRSFALDVNVDGKFGLASLTSKNVKFAHVTFPSLLALGIDSLALRRNHIEELIGEGPTVKTNETAALPMVMARFVGNEMEPTAKVKLYNIRLEYHVSTVMAMLGLTDDESAAGIVSDMASSVVNLTGRRTASTSPPRLSSQDSVSSDTSFANSIALRLDVVLRNSIVGLNPRNSTAKGLIVLTDTHFTGSMPKGEEANATLEIRKASLMVIDDLENVINPEPSASPALSVDRRSQTDCLVDMGFVSVSLISAAKATLQVVKLETDTDRSIDVELRDDLFVLESCADSTQTLQAILNGLKPPMPTSKELKYRTEIIPVEDMLASFSGDAFATTHSNRSSDDDAPLGLEEGDMMGDEVPQNLEFVSSFYNPDPEAIYEGIADSMLEDDLESLASPSVIREIGDKNLLESFQEQTQIAPGNASLHFEEDHFRTESIVGGTAHRWNTKQNTYGLPNECKLGRSQLRIRVRDVHIIWNLYDGYDWQRTRDTLSQAVADVQSKATERLARKDKRKSFDPDEEEEDVIGDFLFNSIYIGIPANRDPTELARQINSNIDDLASETESYATSTSSRSPSRQARVPRSRGKKLQLKRSKYHKMTFELKGVAADVVFYPPGSGETQSSIDVRVQDLEIFDHVPTSTWKKFATYMHDAGERESGTSMVHIEILNVKPVPDLAASEIILKVSLKVLHTASTDVDKGYYSAFKTSCRSRCLGFYDSLFRVQRRHCITSNLNIRLAFPPAC